MQNTVRQQVHNAATLLYVAGAWRATQGIYRFHPIILEALLDSKVTGTIPVDPLLRLPEWCVFLETPGLRDPVDNQPVTGVFAALRKVETQPLELCLQTLHEDGSTALSSIPLGVGSLKDAIDGLRDARGKLRAGSFEPGQGYTDLEEDEVERYMRYHEGLISLVLYLCAEEAEIPTRPSLPRERVVQGKKRPILPVRPLQVHECGYRFGAAFESARKEREARARGQGGEGLGLTPHVRRAHWHGHWTGPRGSTNRKMVLRWHHATQVGFDGAAAVATLRPVEEVT